VVGAEDEPHGVEQKDGRLGWVGHGSEFNRDQRSGVREQVNGAASKLAAMRP